MWGLGSCTSDSSSKYKHSCLVNDTLSVVLSWFYSKTTRIQLSHHWETVAHCLQGLNTQLYFHFYTLVFALQHFPHAPYHAMHRKLHTADFICVQIFHVPYRILWNTQSSLSRLATMESLDCAWMFRGILCGTWKMCTQLKCTVQVEWFSCCLWCLPTSNSWKGMDGSSHIHKTRQHWAPRYFIIFCLITKFIAVAIIITLCLKVLNLILHTQNG